MTWTAILRSTPPVPARETLAHYPEQSLPAVLVRWRSDPARGALAAHPAKYRLQWPDIPACNRPPGSTSESPSPCSRNHSRNPSTSVHSASWRLAELLRHSSGSAAVAESASPNLPPIEPVHPLVTGRHPFPQQQRCQPPVTEPHALGRQFLQSRSQRRVPRRFPRSIGMGWVDRPNPVSLQACRSSSGTPPRRSSRLPEVPLALPVF